MTKKKILAFFRGFLFFPIGIAIGIYVIRHPLWLAVLGSLFVLSLCIFAGLNCADQVDEEL